MSSTYTESSTYTVADIEVVMRRVTADLVMIATSTKAVTEQKARDWAHDIEHLAKKGYLKSVDLTLLSGTAELKATRFEVHTESGELTMSRPGGVLWPAVAGAELRIVLTYTKAYTAEARAKLAASLNCTWVKSYDDISHSALKASTGRDYESNGFGTRRTDYSK